MVLRKFAKSPEHPDLKNHYLRDKMKGFRSFTIDDDCRVIYKETEKSYLFYDIGTHQQVYKKKRIKKMNDEFYKENHQ